MWSRIRSTLVVGLLATAPLALTVYIFLVFIEWFDSLFQPIAQQIPYLPENIWGLGIVVGIILVFVVGIVAPSILGRQLLIVSEKIVEKLPLVKLVYSGTKQIFDSFKADTFKKFNRVVLIEFPRPGAYAIAMVTADYQKSVIENRNITVAVFVPTTPNPTSGYLLFLSPEQITPVSMGVDEALKVIISGGIVQPQFAQTGGPIVRKA
jgi:uncharacterized membrane protein